MLSFTTSKRYRLFEETLRSLTRCVRDINLISNVLIVDDGSPSGEIEQMICQVQSALPGRPVSLSTVPAPKGHAASMRRWYDLISGDFVFHCEDDWQFMRTDQVIRRSIDILRKNLSFGQIVFSKDAKEVSKAIFPEQGYWTYNFNERQAYSQKFLGTWPHFMLNPSIIKIQSLRATGNFMLANRFEYQYGRRWYAAGNRTVFLDPKVAIHLGGGQSAYDINNTAR